MPGTIKNIALFLGAMTAVVVVVDLISIPVLDCCRKYTKAIPQPGTPEHLQAVAQARQKIAEGA